MYDISYLPREKNHRPLVFGFPHVEIYASHFMHYFVKILLNWDNQIDLIS